MEFYLQHYLVCFSDSTPSKDAQITTYIKDITITEFHIKHSTAQQLIQPYRHKNLNGPPLTIITLFGNQKELIKLGNPNSCVKVKLFYFFYASFRNSFETKVLKQLVLAKQD